jgi:hypothetical protein
LANIDWNFRFRIRIDRIIISCHRNSCHSRVATRGGLLKWLCLSCSNAIPINVLNVPSVLAFIFFFNGLWCVCRCEGRAYFIRNSQTQNRGN